MKSIAILLPLGALLAACNPTAAEVETVLRDRGFGVREASCVARELGGRLDERDWRLIAEIAGDTMRTSEEWRDMSVGELSDKLMRLGDTRLMATLLRAGIGCSLLGEGAAARSATL